MRLLLIAILIPIASYSQSKPKLVETKNSILKKDLVLILDTIWVNEQTPIRTRDSLIDIYGAESEEAAFYQKIYRENHKENIKKVKTILDTYGWPDSELAGANGNRTICNVLQHADQETREYYIPLMKQAVLDKKLEASLLVRAQDRIATDRGELQIYGGQMKYYPETKSFNVWPIFEPENIDKRRAEIGLGPISEHLMNSFNFVWNLEEQQKRTEQFIKDMKTPK